MPECRRTVYGISTGHCDKNFSNVNCFTYRKHPKAARRARGPGVGATGVNFPFQETGFSTWEYVSSTQENVSSTRGNVSCTRNFVSTTWVIASSIQKNISSI